ncbi:MAG: hypothetical protein KGQ60_19375, partial [Planctomycetes bacterium]|nr:hypothetical protein [Planctomycetota bacterium]
LRGYTSRRGKLRVGSESAKTLIVYRPQTSMCSPRKSLLVLFQTDALVAKSIYRPAPSRLSKENFPC